MGNGNACGGRQINRRGSIPADPGNKGQRRCPFCLNPDTARFSDKKRAYILCSGCGGISVPPEYFISAEAQTGRYLKHRNTLADSGYADFLRSFIKPIYEFLSQTGYAVHSALDYGCGPQPALVQLMEQEIYPHAQIRGWDPIFAQNTPFFTDGADLVTCLEAAEHFEYPDEGFAGLASACRDGGYAAAGTLTVPPGQIQTFLNWWYKEDPTHVSFYTEKAIRAAASRQGLYFVRRLSDRIFLFRKQADII